MQIAVRVKGGDIHDGRFGCDAVQLHALCAVLIIIRLSLGGENEAVVVLIPLAGKGAVIAVAPPPPHAARLRHITNASSRYNTFEFFVIFLPN